MGWLYIPRCPQCERGGLLTVIHPRQHLWHFPLCHHTQPEVVVFPVESPKVFLDFDWVLELD